MASSTKRRRRKMVKNQIQANMATKMDLSQVNQNPHRIVRSKRRTRRAERIKEENDYNKKS